MYIDQEERPKVQSAANYGFAVALHLVLFLGLWWVGQLKLSEKPLVIPMDWTVVPVENLNGDENEPPPLKPEDLQPPEPPPPEPEPVVEPPPAPPPVTVEAKEAVVEKPKEPEKPKEKPKEPEPPKVEEKKPEPKPEPPKKTAAELREEKLRRMRESAKDVKDKPKPTEPPRTGKTGRKTLSDAEIAKMLAMGAKAGAVESIPNNEMEQCLYMLKNAIDKRWALVTPQIGRTGTVTITIKLNSAGAIATARLAQSCGDPVTDAAALKVVQGVGTVRGLTRDFIAKYSAEPITILYEVTSSR